MAYIHRFGSSLNEQLHFHVTAVDGVLATLMTTNGLLETCRSWSSAPAANRAQQSLQSGHMFLSEKLLRYRSPENLLPDCVHHETGLLAHQFG